MRQFGCLILLILVIAGCQPNETVAVSGVVLTAADLPESSIGSESLVIDARWQRVPGATITLLSVDADRRVLASARSDENGRYEIQIPPQEVILRVEKEGYQPVERTITAGSFGHFIRNTIVLMPVQDKV